MGRCEAVKRKVLSPLHIGENATAWAVAEGLQYGSPDVFRVQSLHYVHPLHRPGRDLLLWHMIRAARLDADWGRQFCDPIDSLSRLCAEVHGILPHSSSKQMLSGVVGRVKKYSRLHSAR